MRIPLFQIDAFTGRPFGGNPAAVAVRTLGRAARHRDFWLLAGLAFAWYGCYLAVQGLWGGPYLMEVLKLTREETGRMLMFTSIGFICGSLVIDSPTSALAALSLILFPQITYESQRDLTHSVLATSLAAATFLCAARNETRQRRPAAPCQRGSALAEPGVRPARAPVGRQMALPPRPHDPTQRG